jgi:radical SAM superfamily enzyme YgiQ (UPF0313 family)
LKVVFVIPPSLKKEKIPERLFGCSYTVYSMPNLGILYSAAVLKEKGIEVEIFDGTKMVMEEFWQKLPEADFYVFHTVLLSAPADIRVAKKISKKNKVIFFGPHPTYVPKDFLLNENCLVARGEADFLIAEIVTAKDPRKLKGVSFLKNGKVYHNKTWGIIEDLDKLPFPARELDPNEYRSLKLKDAKFTVLLGSRQCSYRCYFCVPNSISWARELEWKIWAKKPGKPPVKVRSAKNIIAEVKDLVKKGYREFSFIDDQFLWARERTLEISQGLRNLNIEYGILARADRLVDEEVVRVLAESGCRYVDIGVESFDQRVLDYVRKDLKIETVYRAIDLLNKYGITPKLNIMFGTSPLETKELLEKYIQETLKLPVSYCMYSIATPFPGTEFEKIAKKRGWFKKGINIYNELDPAKKSLISYPHLSAKQLERIVLVANRRFYLRPKILLKQVLKIRSFSGLIDAIKGGFCILIRK